MLNEHYTECRVLPAINETFPQFSRSLHCTYLTPLDLSLRASAIIPITPPSTPSPPRKRQRLMSDKQYLWRPHAIVTTTQSTSLIPKPSNGNKNSNNNATRENTSTSNSTSPAISIDFAENITGGNYAPQLPLSYDCRLTDELMSLTALPAEQTTSGYKNNLQEMRYKNYEEIPESQARAMPPQPHHELIMEAQQQQKHLRQQSLQPTPAQLTSIICVDDETIVLTEDEDDEGEEEEDAAAYTETEVEVEAEEEAEEEEETLVSSHGCYSEDMYDEEGGGSAGERRCDEKDYYCQDENEDTMRTDKASNHQTSTHVDANSDDESKKKYYQSTQRAGVAREHINIDEASVYGDDDDEEEYVDILSNDDDDLNPHNSANLTQRLRVQALEEELEKSGKVLTRNKLTYDNAELHHRAIDGLAKLFDRNFDVPPMAYAELESNKSGGLAAVANKQSMNTHTTATEDVELSQHGRIKVNSLPSRNQQNQHPHHHSQPHHSSHQQRTHKTERKRMKLRKHQLAADEETISPVSGTIIRKLRDDEELVVRKGDIDPAFNVVEITEEAKAILASIDNKIGDYLCQLCRTLYDDAFQLAQHRCPRIVHIEYKCSECEKVFNCPANLASHRRWHKPKSELMANSAQSKKRHLMEHAGTIPAATHEKANALEEGLDGIYPCTQCGKNFRRHAYLKKHQLSHQMLENLKSLDIFKNSNSLSNHGFAHQLTQTKSHFPFPNLPAATETTSHSSHTHTPHYRPLHTTTIRPYPQRFNTNFPFSTTLDQRRFYSLGELYLSQHLDRTSAFQYVQANHLRNLNAAAGLFAAPRPPFIEATETAPPQPPLPPAMHALTAK